MFKCIIKNNNELYCSDSDLNNKLKLVIKNDIIKTISYGFIIF